ncbi:MAG: ABC transporter substrate-binding protein [Deltaproteobacteria bacterium]|nr:ABC transporter substrate-binding protein [Deltaproteobacteria bacterium]
MAGRISRRRFIKKGLAAAGGVVALGTAIDRLGPALYAQTKPPIRIGAQGILSGPYGGYGEFGRQGGLLAVEEINHNGGILGREVEIRFRDEELKPPITVSNLRYFVQDWGADVAIGIDASNDVLAAAEVMPQLDRVLIVHHAATEKLNEIDVYQKHNQYVFRVCVPVYQDGIASALIAKDFHHVKRWATISPDYEYGYTCWKFFRQVLSHFRPDVQYVGEAWCKFNTADFAPYISKVMAQKPEGIFSTQWGGEAVAFVRQAKRFGVFQNIGAMMIGMGAAMDVLEGLGAEYPDGVWASCRYWFRYPETERNKAFVGRYHKRWGHYPSYPSEMMYSCVNTAKAAMEKAHSTKTADLIAALQGMELDTPAGKRLFRAEDHQAVYPVPWGQITHDPAYPMPIIANLKVSPTTEYYRWPPFTKLFGV